MGLLVRKNTPRKAKQKSYSNKDVRSTVKESNIVYSPKGSTASKKLTSDKGNRSLASENRERGKVFRKQQKRAGSRRS